ncbi:MAG: protein translocase subunit SecF [Elusimicrobia bacterium]|nr:protein translocase subunit SecF [Candidatus Obscuribacterium magneticum]
MEFFHGTKIDFIGKRYFFFAVSLAFLGVASYGFVKQKGPILGLEFTGGTLIQIGFKSLPPIDAIRGHITAAEYEGFGLQTQPSTNSIIIRVKSGVKSKEDVASELLNILRTNYPDNVKPHVDRIEFIGPVIGKKLIRDTFFAILGSLGVILIYVAFRFRNFIWAFTGVLALAHDVFISWGLLTLVGSETTLVGVAALLTIAGYSINDTIVIFDRVREALRTSRKETLSELYNRALNETLGRTVNTSMTVLMASLSLLFLGGQVIREFAMLMTFGTFIGVYSTVAVALGLVYEFETRREK